MLLLSRENVKAGLVPMPRTAPEAVDTTLGELKAMVVASGMEGVATAGKPSPLTTYMPIFDAKFWASLVGAARGLASSAADDCSRLSTGGAAGVVVSSGAENSTVVAGAAGVISFDIVTGGGSRVAVGWAMG